MIAPVMSSEFKVLEYHQSPQTPYIVRQILTQYPQNNVINYLREFIGQSRPNRLVGSETHGQVATFLKQKLGGLGDEKQMSQITIKLQEFSPHFDQAIAHFEQRFQQEIHGVLDEESDAYKRGAQYTESMVAHLQKLKKKQHKGQNIIWEKKGSAHSEEVLILGAYYDTLVIDGESWKLNPAAKMPGADANASGVAVLLALAEVLTHINLPRTVRLIFFDYSEFGALGAQAYIESLPENSDLSKVSFLNITQIGHDTRREDSTGREGNMKVYYRKNDDATPHPQDHKLAEDLLARAQSVGNSVHFEPDPRGYELADQTPFWEAGIAAVVFTQNREDDPNKRHHSSDDFVETLNFRTLNGAFRTIAGAVIHWAYQF